MNLRRAGAAALALGGIVAAAAGQPVSGDIIIMEGDALDESNVASLNAPFTNGNGQVGFVAALDDGTRSIWFDTGSIFNSGDVVSNALTGGEGTMGISDAGDFIYSPSVDGGDSVWGSGGLIQGDNVPAPGFPGFNTTFNSRPQMDDVGNAYWIAGLNDGAGGTSSQNRVLYKRDTGGTTTALWTAGDAIGGSGGLSINTGSGVDFDYHNSGDGSQMINVFTSDSGSSTDDGVLVVNGTQIARESFANGQGDNWDNFDVVSINNSGNYVFSGDTDGAITSDEFIAYNGNIVLREGDSVAGGNISGAVDAASINNNDEAVFIWDLDGTESLFFSSDASNLSAAQVLLAVGDGFDADGNGTADWIVDDFNASSGIGPGLDFAEDGWVYVEVDLESLDGLTNLEAIIRVRVPAPGTLALFAGAGLLATRRRR